MQELDNNVAVVTGGSSGIGKATAHKLAEENTRIVLASRSEDELQETADNIESEHGVETLVVPTDVTDEEAVEKLFDQTVEVFGQVDIVVSNAGLVYTGDVEDMPTEHFEKTNEVNINGMFYVAKKSISYLKETEGNLIFLGSIAGQYPRGTNPVYAASKWWTRGFARSLSAQIGDEGVAVTVVNPSEVRTEFNSETGTAFRDEFEEGSVTEPEQIAEGILFAAKQDSNNTVAELDLYRRDKLGDMELG